MPQKQENWVEEFIHLLKDFVQKYEDQQVQEEQPQPSQSNQPSQQSLYIPTYGRWKPNHAEMYSYITSKGSIYSTTWRGDEEDLYRYNSRNVYRTPYIAERMREYYNARAEVEWKFTTEEWKSWDDPIFNYPKYRIRYCHSDERFEIVWDYTAHDNTQYYKTFEDAKQLILDYTPEMLIEWGIKNDLS